jgi:hypothetical protein
LVPPFLEDLYAAVMTRFALKEQAEETQDGLADKWPVAET